MSSSYGLRQSRGCGSKRIHVLKRHEGAVGGSRLIALPRGASSQIGLPTTTLSLLRCVFVLALGMSGINNHFSVFPSCLDSGAWSFLRLLLGSGKPLSGGSMS